MCVWSAPLAVVYFAVGPISLKKAMRSARSARLNGGDWIETVLISSISTNLEYFDMVIPLTDLSFSNTEFMATRQVVRTASGELRIDGTDTATIWRDRDRRSSNLALRSLRAAKVEAIRQALLRYERIIFLDADTYVCQRLDQAVCGLEPPISVAFVPVKKGREHGIALLASSSRWRTPRNAPEANTGVLAIRNDSYFIPLLFKAWTEAYFDLSASGFLMDQPAFRAALYSTQTPYALLPTPFNCRGHQRRPKNSSPHHRTAVPLRCRGWPNASLAAGVQTQLNGGRGCIVLHSHDIQEED